MPNRRLPAAAAFFAAALTAFAVLLWGLQVTSGAAYYAKSQRSWFPFSPLWMERRSRR